MPRGFYDNEGRLQETGEIQLLTWEAIRLSGSKREPRCNNLNAHPEAVSMNSFPLSYHKPLEFYECPRLGCKKRITVDQIVDTAVEVTSKIMQDLEGNIAIIFNGSFHIL